ncbi:hypothetical protein BZG36_04462 [Bifiguratus adelaidae]|uniref:V-type proton ATPase subunit a n=1 Tax=Bifiguratus adelaidae TaxID=1938954 RepID=A0A261XVQ4_9FUNG|nr:hypothetical protein BZG36_04462 [Bifiguratus adelaidae]
MNELSSPKSGQLIVRCCGVCLSADMLRSENMTHVTFYLPDDSHFVVEFIMRMGQLGCFMPVTDESAGVKEDRRNSVTQKVAFFRAEKNLLEQASRLLGRLDNLCDELVPGDQSLLWNRSLYTLHSDVQRHWEEIEGMISTYADLAHQESKISDWMLALQAVNELWPEPAMLELYRTNSEAAEGMLRDAEHGETEESPFLGREWTTVVIEKSKALTLERILWRWLHGNIYFHVLREMQEPSSMASHHDDDALKRALAGLTESGWPRDVVLLMIPGVELARKVEKIVEAMGGRAFAVSKDQAQRDHQIQHLAALHVDLEEASTWPSKMLSDYLDKILTQSRQEIEHHLREVALALPSWKASVRKFGEIYRIAEFVAMPDGSLSNTARGIRQQRALLCAWCPSKDLPKCHSLAFEYKHAVAVTYVQIPSWRPSLPHELRPPTLIRTNEFTKPFQALIDAYGVPRYKEINPGIFAIVSFPFLFAVMFGDAGHGFILVFAAVTMLMLSHVLRTKRLDEISSMIFYGRHLILMLGLFSIYAGFIYNDVFSIAMKLAPSQYFWKHGRVEACRKDGYTYPFGVDHAWHQADNGLIFLNSYKMKQAVILGVLQMLFGIFLCIPNHNSQGQPEYVLVETLPEITFLTSLFGYLVGLIIFKWLVDWKAKGQNPPSLLNVFLEMMLRFGSVSPENKMFPGQVALQKILLSIAVCSAAALFLGKPFAIMLMHRLRRRGYQIINDEISAAAAIPPQSDSEQFNCHEEDCLTTGDIFVLQGIHCLEFCLSCVSQVASYLRLWALSLAHEQLSQVLLDLVLLPSLRVQGLLRPVAFVFCSLVWLALTIGIMIMMEGLSAFLHSLRLHWVEFNSKFYQGDGYPYEPFVLS